MHKIGFLHLAEESFPFEGINAVLKKNSLPFEIEGMVLLPEQNLQTALENMKPEVTAFLVSSAFFELPTSLLERASIEARQNKSADGFIKHAGQFWPRLILHQALAPLLSIKKYDLDSQGRVMVFGSSVQSRQALFSIARFGFKRYAILGETSQTTEDFLQESGQYAWATDRIGLNSSTLTLVPGIYSVVLNTLNEASEVTIQEEISYFNYLSQVGVVLDFKLRTQRSLFLTEAEKIGARVIRGQEIWSARIYALISSLHKKTLHPQLILEMADCFSTEV